MTFFMLRNFLPFVVETSVPLLFRMGQYQHVLVLLQIGVMILAWVVLFDTPTNWSERFLLQVRIMILYHMILNVCYHFLKSSIEFAYPLIPLMKIKCSFTELCLFFLRVINLKS